MSTNSLLRLSVLLTLCVQNTKSFSQNLVPNPDFEIFSSCPPGFGAGGPLASPPWQAGTSGTPDYFHVCATSDDVSVPANYFGMQSPRSGEGYAGFYCKYANFLYREYIQVRLTEPLVAGARYEVKYYVSLAENSCPIKKLGAYFSANPPDYNLFWPIPVIPQVQAYQGYIRDKDNWTLISGCFVAEGGEEWMTIGNFYEDDETQVQPGCDVQSIYYYIDDVSVELSDSCRFPPVINGTVTLKNGSVISDVPMLLSENTGFSQPEVQHTDEEGYYAFNWLTPDSSYYLKGNKTTNILQGVSTLDLIRMQKHLLGREVFTSLHQYVASDIDHNGMVNVMDAVELRKAILGIYDEFPHNTSWRYGVLPQDFSGSDISSLIETATIPALHDSATTIDFRGIKIGDVNENVSLNINDGHIDIRHDDVIILPVTYKKIENGNAFSVDVRSPAELSIVGLQFAFDCRDLELISVEGVAISLDDENVFHSNDGLLRISWNHVEGAGVDAHDVLFRLTFSSEQGGMLSEKITLARNDMSPEIYLGVELRTLELDFAFPDAPSPDLHSFSVFPNPAQTTINLAFNLDHSGEVIIHFFDLSGHLLHSAQKEYPAGNHNEEFKTKHLDSVEGVVFCRIVTGGFTGTQKLILLK